MTHCPGVERTAGRTRNATADYLPARENLRNYLTANLQWNQRNAALLVEYASLEFGGKQERLVSRPRDRWDSYGYWDPSELTN